MENVMGNTSHEEGKVAESIEEQTAKLPSDIFLWSAMGAMTLALCCHLSGRKHTGLFFGQWAAPLLILGVYNKMVKQHGSD
jgi:hypothetical protein